MKSMLKRAISIVLVAILLISALPIASFATINSYETSTCLVVPETIYLKPSLTPSVSAQYYVNNTLDFNTNEITPDAQNNADAGKFYFRCMNTSSIIVSTYYNDALVDRFELTDSSYMGDYSKIDYTMSDLSQGIPAGEISMLKWVVTVVSDGVEENYTAYTVLYSPFLSPVAAAARLDVNGNTGTDNWSSFDVQGLSWISGIHGIGSISTQNSAGYVYPAKARVGYLVPLLNGGNIMQPTTGDGIDVRKYTSYDSGVAANELLSNYSVCILSNSRTKHHNDYSAYVTSYDGLITVDSSRYSNLNTIPNLTIGTAVTYYTGDNYRKSKRLQYYISDYSTLVNNTSIALNNIEEENHNQYNNNTGVLFPGYDKGANQGATPFLDGPIYNGTWDKALTDIQSGTKIAIKGAFMDHTREYGVISSDSGAGSLNCISTMTVTTVNKSALRNAVFSSSNIGGSSDWYQDISLWNAYQNALQSACKILGDPTMSDQIEIDNATTALTTAYNNLCANIKQATFNAYHFGYIKQLNLDGSFSGNYYTLPLTRYDNEINKTASAKANLMYGSNSYTNYTYIGYKNGIDRTFGGEQSGASIIYSRAYNTFNQPIRSFHYKANDATLTLVLGDNATYDAVCSTTINGSVGTVYQLPQSVPTRLGYRFVRWDYSGYGGSLNSSTNTITFGTTNTLTAVWQECAEPDDIYISADIRKYIIIAENDIGLIEKYGRQNIRTVGVKLGESASTNLADYSQSVTSNDGATVRCPVNNNSEFLLQQQYWYNCVEYLPSGRFMNSSSVFTVLIECTDSNGNKNYYSSRLTINPARTVTYLAGLCNDFTLSDGWEGYNNTFLEDYRIFDSVDYNDNFANCNFYDDSRYQGFHGFGSITSLIHPENNPVQTMKFTFEGTGFDILASYGRSANNVPLIVTVDGKKRIVDINSCYYENELFDNVFVPSIDDFHSLGSSFAPVFSIRDLEYGFHSVEIEARYAKAFDPYGQGAGWAYIQGVRLHNTNLSYANGMKVVSFENINALVQNTDIIPSPEALLLMNSTPIDFNDYPNYGPKNELYLAPDHTVTFRVHLENMPNIKLFIGASLTRYLNDPYTIPLNISTNNQSTEITLKTGYNQLFEILDLDWIADADQVIAITNNGTYPVSLSDLVITSTEDQYLAAPANVTFSAPEVASVMTLLSRPVTVEGGSQFYPTSIEATEPTDIEEGDTTEITVNTAKDVARLTINGENAHRSNSEDGYNWTIPFTANSVGTQSFEIVAYNSSGIRSEATTITVDVNEKTVIDIEEPTEPTEPTEPVEPTDPTEPVAPTEPTEPDAPTAPQEPEEIKTKIQIFFEKLKHIFSVIINFFKNLF